METKLQFQHRDYCLKRYPKTTDASLRAWSNAELLALDYISDKQPTKIHTFNDRFGVWNVTLQDKNPTTIWTYASQQKAIFQNLRLNDFSLEVNFKTPLDNLQDVDIALIKVPKSLGLLELFLQQIHKAATKKTEVVCCFMTKYFSSSVLKIASQYFEEVEQTKAWKKARLLILKHPKLINQYKELVNTIHYNKFDFQQYYGVFSSDKIDIGTQFLLKYLDTYPQENKILDLASGNGVIAHQVLEQNSQSKLTLIDDFNLAIASSKLNIKSINTTFICNDTLQEIQDDTFDLVVSNPPFHFEHENNIEVSLYLFKEVQRILKSNGRFVLVANKHLNYKTHLQLLFQSVETIADNKRFVIYECGK